MIKISTAKVMPLLKQGLKEYKKYKKKFFCTKFTVKKWKKFKVRIVFLFKACIVFLFYHVFFNFLSVKKIQDV